MGRALRSRTIRIAGASAAAHALVLAAIWVQAPRLVAPEQDAGPPQPIIPVLILPRTPPPEAGGPPAPIRLHRRRQRFSPEESPVAPLVTPQAPRAAAEPGPSPRALPSPDDAVATNARQALRGGLIGCANADALGLSREEREKCENRLAEGAGEAEFPGLGIEEDKDSAFARAAARKSANRRYRGTPPTPPVAQSRGGPGASAEEMGRALGNDRPAATRPF